MNYSLLTLLSSETIHLVKKMAEEDDFSTVVAGLASGVLLGSVLGRSSAVPELPVWSMVEGS